MNSIPTLDERPAPWRRLPQWLLLFAAIAVAGALFVAIRHLLGAVAYDDVLLALRSTPTIDLLLALAATGGSYLALVGYDWSGLRHAGARLPLSLIAVTSCCAYALGNSVGLGALTGGAVRFRLYSAGGLEPGAIGRAIAFMAAAFGVGIALVSAIAVLCVAPQLGRVLHLSALLLQVPAASVLLAGLGLFWLCLRAREVRLFGRWPIRLPTPALALAQLLFSAADLLLASLALWVLLPQAALPFGEFFALYALAIGVGVISHLPGGIGAFEAIMLLGIGDRVPVPVLAAALVLYRGIYHLLPLFAAVAWLGVNELRVGVARGVGRVAVRSSPQFVAALTMIVGLMLMFSGAIPATDAATARLARIVPIQLMEASHFLASLLGLGLLFVARGLLHRLRTAWWVALSFGALSLALALPKGLAVTEMIVLSFLVLVLLAARRRFDRRASLFAQAFAGGWMLTAVAAVAAMAWLFLFVYQQVAYTGELWWRFAFDGHAPRGLRATTAAAVATLALILWQGLRPSSGRVHPPTPAELARAAQRVASQPRADAGLALLGDKSFLFSASGEAFISYAKRGRTWAALFDPTGPVHEWPELIWSFIELVAEHGGRPSFYQVLPAQLPLYLDAGMQALKLGEYASVPLADFGVQGPARAPLRHALSRGERDGLDLDVLPPGSAHRVMPQLQAISGEWLARHNTREKGFSMGALQADFLDRFPLALLMQAGRPVAFASLLVGGERREVAVDLMRYADSAPRGAMDYLFVRLMLHFRSLGYTDFGLGMAPLSGLTAHALAPRWHRYGSLVFRHGEQFYNFQGLRAFKQKFAPVWEPRYLCAPGGLQSWLALADIAALSGGGLRGVFSR